MYVGFLSTFPLFWSALSLSHSPVCESVDRHGDIFIESIADNEPLVIVCFGELFQPLTEPVAIRD